MIDHLTTVGPLLYGSRWQSEIGRALGVTDRTMRRWLAVDTAPPDDVGRKLRHLIEERIEELKAAKRSIPR